MTSDVQLTGPAGALLAEARRVVPAWLARLVDDAARAAGVDVGSVRVERDAMVARESALLLDRLAALLATDVDAQGTNPLSLFRAAVAGPTAVLAAAGVPAPPPEPFASSAFPDDVYRLGPATWADVDPDLHEPGLTWGAWKAMTVLRRRREEGLR